MKKTFKYRDPDSLSQLISRLDSIIYANKMIPISIDADNLPNISSIRYCST